MSGPEAGARRNPMGVAFRIGTELLGGVLVGGFIGWQLDRWLGTLPVMLVIFLLLGGAAGIWSVVRTALKMQADAESAGRETDGPGSPPGAA